MPRPGPPVSRRMPALGAAGEPSQFRVLARTFLDRFFETEITGGAADLRMSLFWMMAFLAVPGVFFPILTSVHYNVVAIFQGPEALRIVSRGHKAFYLGFAMVASGALSAMIWNCLLLDRRDSLVLGALPVRGPTIVRAKLAALAGYILLVAVAMHALASVSYGLTLSVHSSAGFALRSIVAHFVASTAASAFVFLAVAAVQGVLFAAVGPRRFHALSTVSQVLVVALVLGGLIILPDFGPEPAPWLFRTPPLWFLGIYESILSTHDQVWMHMNRVAIGALLVAGAATVVSYPLAYRRLVSTVVGSAAGTRRHSLGTIAAWLVRGLSRSPVTRASSQFFLASSARNTRQRLILAASVGASIAVTTLALFRGLPALAEPFATPPIAILGLPFHAMVFLLVGLRVTAAVPVDLRAAWVIACAGPSAVRVRAGVWRVMFAVAVVPVTVMTLPVYWRQWGASVVFTHALVCLVLGAALTEALLWGFDGLACARPWRPEHANLRAWWPAYLSGYLLITAGLPAIEQGVFGAPVGTTVLVAALAAIGFALRLSHRRRRVMPPEDLDEPGAVQVLNLS